MKRKTTDEFKREVLFLTDSEYECVGNYTNNKEKTRFFHTICKSYFDMKPNKFLEGHRCPICNNMCRKNIKQAREKVAEKDDSMFILEDFSGMTKDAKFIHTDCGRTFYMKPADVIKGKKCPFCSNKIYGPEEKFQNKLNRKFPNLLLAERYKGSKKKIQFICKACNSKYYVKPERILKISQCPGCRDKEISNRIGRFLTAADIPFKRNETIFNGALLSFAYFLPTFNLAIDYCGRLYFNDDRDIKSASNERFKKQLKSNYCKENKIKYLQIPFWKDDSIYQILYDLFLVIDENSSYTAFNKWRLKEDLRIIQSLSKK